jgi:hypothetical protein
LANVEAEMPAGASLIESHRIRFGFASIGLALVLSLASAPARAPEIFGRVILSDGKTPAVNKPISLAGKPVGSTDAGGGYRLALPPGQYTLTIDGKSVPIVVPPPGIRQDIRLP